MYGGPRRTVYARAGRNCVRAAPSEGAPSRGFLEQGASATTQGAAGIFNRIYIPFCTPDGRLAQPYDLMDLARSSGGEQRARAEAFCDAERTLSCDLDFVAVSIRNFVGADPERLICKQEEIALGPRGRPRREVWTSTGGLPERFSE